MWPFNRKSKRIADEDFPDLTFRDVKEIGAVADPDENSPKVVDREINGKPYRLRKVFSTVRMSHEYLLVNTVKSEGNEDDAAIDRMYGNREKGNPEGLPVYRVISCARNPSGQQVGVPVLVLPAKHNEDAWDKALETMRKEMQFPEDFTFSVYRIQRTGMGLRESAENTTAALREMFESGNRPEWYPPKEETEE